ACGRATVEALQMNNQTVVKARRRWVIGGWHPPTD
ncbi:MAG: HNH endonuclease, partial [Chloroflexi bacterium]